MRHWLELIIDYCKAIDPNREAKTKKHPAGPRIAIPLLTIGNQIPWTFPSFITFAYMNANKDS